MNPLTDIQIDPDECYDVRLTEFPNRRTETRLSTVTFRVLKVNILYLNSSTNRYLTFGHLVF